MEDKKTKGFPSYQYSFFIGEDQIVIRSNDWSEFVLDVQNAITKYKTKMDTPTENKPEPKTASVACLHQDGYYVNQVKKEGENQGRHFKTCKKCKKFLGFTQEELTTWNPKE